jgi:hypothetical protein
MLLSAHIFIFKQFLDQIPLQTDVKTAQRRWLLLQALPGCRIGQDIFSSIFSALCCADVTIMENLTFGMLQTAVDARGELFPVKHLPLFIILDEAQVAANTFKKSF